MEKFFAIILSDHDLKPHIADIAMSVVQEKDRKKLSEILEEYHIKDIRDIKPDLLDLLMRYIRLALKDHHVTEEERKNVERLKKLFKIREGDLFNEKRDEIREILQQHFSRLYADKKIDMSEALYKVALQDIFDLGYDQMESFASDEVIKALGAGASPRDLDIAKIPKH